MINRGKSIGRFRTWLLFGPGLTYYFGGMPPTFLRTNSRSTQIVSLSIEETQQLLSLHSYNQSLEQLEKNNLAQSLNYLKFALHEAQTHHPHSISLHTCILSRVSILHKLMNQSRSFVETLQAIYLSTLSSKGNRHLTTIKSLINYFIALTIHEPSKCQSVLQFLKEGSAKGQVPDYLIFFEALTEIRRNRNYEKGLSKLKELPEQSAQQKIFKFNNIGAMMLFTMKQKNDPQNYGKQIKKEAEKVLEYLLKALIHAQNNPEDTSSYQEQEIRESERIISHLEKYLNKQTHTLPSDPLAKQILKHTNSHIIAMNIATLLFDVQRPQESFYFLKIALDKAVALGQLQRVGMALILLARHYYQQDNSKWEETLMDILTNAKRYPPLIVKQSLQTYSQFLVAKGRLFETQNYLHQAATIECNAGLQGLILPNYDFSF